MTLPGTKLNAVTNPMQSHINVGTGVDITIRELAETLQTAIGYQGALTFDTTKLDGTPRKLRDVTKINQRGWQASYNLEAGLRSTYAWFLAHAEALRG